MTNLIVAKQLTKEFQKYKAIENLNFTVEKGEILGFLGPSGSGKTTTINILTGQLTPSQGETYILGKSSLQLKEDDLSKIGLITENSGFYEKLTLYDNLLFFAKLYNVSTEYVDDLLKRVGLYDHRKTLAEKLSTGMKQRMLLVRAIINKPKVLFLDEPTSGLDPSTSQTIHSLIEELKQQGTTIFLTTHDMHEATILCDTVIDKTLQHAYKPAVLIFEAKYYLFYENNRDKAAELYNTATVLAEAFGDQVFIKNLKMEIKKDLNIE